MSRRYHNSFYFYLGLIGNLLTLPFADVSVVEVVIYLYPFVLLSSLKQVVFISFFFGKIHIDVFSSSLYFCGLDDEWSIHPKHLTFHKFLPISLLRNVSQHWCFVLTFNRHWKQSIRWATETATAIAAGSANRHITYTCRIYDMANSTWARTHWVFYLPVINVLHFPLG